MAKIAAYVLIILGGVPLLIYPFVLLADVMSLAGDSRNAPPGALAIVARAFLLMSLAYPAVYLPCATLAVRNAGKRRSMAALRFGIAPLGYLLMLAGLFIIWSALE